MDDLEKQQDKELTDKELLQIANRRRKELEAQESQELKPDTPLDSQPTVTKSTKAGNRQAKKGKDWESNRWEAPSKEYIKTANRFFEAIYRQDFTRNETKVLFFLLRKTWGWRKKSEFILLRQFEKELDILKPNISRALSSLVKRRIVIKIDNKRYAIQSDTTLWKDKLSKKKVRKESLTKK